MRKLGSVAGLALALTISSTFAADLPSLKAPIVAPPPAFSWTGLYGGVNIGYGFGNSDQDPGWMAIPDLRPSRAAQSFCRPRPGLFPTTLMACSAADRSAIITSSIPGSSLA